MQDYTVLFTPAVQRAIAKIDREIVRRIKPKVLALGQNPRPAGVLKVQGAENLYRIRVGDFRIVYTIDDAKRIVEVTIVANRRDVYRGI